MLSISVSSLVLIRSYHSSLPEVLPNTQHLPSRAILRPPVAIDTHQWPPDTFTWLANRNCHHIKCWSLFFSLLWMPLFFLVALRRPLRSYSLTEIVVHLHSEIWTASSMPPATVMQQLKPLILTLKHTPNPLTKHRASGRLQMRNPISRSNPNHEEFY